MNKIISFLIVAFFAIPSVQASDSNYYVSIAALSSSLEPVLSNGYKLNTDTDTGVQIAIGKNLNKNWAVELGYAQLGSADVQLTNGTNAGKIKYSQFTFGAVYSDDSYQMTGETITPFVKFGLRSTDASWSGENSGEINYDNKSLGYLGIGVNIGDKQNEPSFNLEYVNYSKDAQAFSISYILPIDIE